MRRTKSRDVDAVALIVTTAGNAFADRGFDGTTIRQITSRAGVNIAAVNYYFRSKEELYTQVLREAKRHVAWIRIADLPGRPEERFRTFVEHFVSSLLDPRRPLWHGRVLAMEMANPTPALGVIIKELTAPLYRDARALVGDIINGQATPAQLDLLTLSVIGQCVLYASSRPLVEKLAIELEKVPNRNEVIATHVADFSLTALRSFNHRPSRKRSAGPRHPNRIGAPHE